MRQSSFNKTNLQFLTWALTLMSICGVAFADAFRADDTGGLRLVTLLKTASTLVQEGEYEEARGVYNQTLSLPELNRNVDLHAFTLGKIADMDIELGYYPAAEETARMAIGLLDKAGLTECTVYTSAERQLADALYGEGYYEQAKSVAEQALTLGRRVYSSSSEDFAFALTSLAQILKMLGDVNRAERLCQEALEIFKSMNPMEQINLGTAYQNLAVIELAHDKAKQALASIDSALATWNTLLPRDHPSRIYALGTKLSACTKLGAFGEGEELIPELLALSELRFGHDHPERVILLNNAAALYVAEKQYSAALPLLSEAAAISERCFAPGHPVRRNTLVNYSYVLAKLNRKEESARARAESMVIRAEPPKNTILPNAFDNPR